MVYDGIEIDEKQGPWALCLLAGVSKGFRRAAGAVAGVSEFKWICRVVAQSRIVSKAAKEVFCVRVWSFPMVRSVFSNVGFMRLSFSTRFGLVRQVQGW